MSNWEWTPRLQRIALIWMVCTAGTIYLMVRASNWFDANVVMLFFQQSYAAAGSKFERFRDYRRHHTTEACICSDGREFKPNFVRSPSGLIRAGVMVLVPIFLGWLWIFGAVTAGPDPTSGRRRFRKRRKRRSS